MINLRLCHFFLPEMSSPSSSAEYIVEGVIMLVVASLGIFLNILSIFYFAQLKHQKTFHRLLLILAMVDTIHLVFSSLTFSIPWFSDSYSNNHWMYLVPYSLPLAQVRNLCDPVYHFQLPVLDQHDCQCVYDHLPHLGEILLGSLPFQAVQEQV